MEQQTNYTHFQANIRLPGHIFPLYGVVDDASLLMLANNGTTPGRVTELLEAEAERIGMLLRGGHTAVTRSADIVPLTTEQYRA